MNCIYCNNLITGRNKGDHIIPQGLGKFLPDLTINHICRDCDSINGNNFEKIVLRTGYIGFFRNIKGIKSKNNKNKPIHSPSLDKFNAPESQQFLITDSKNAEKQLFVNRTGQVRFPHKILINKHQKIIDEIDIPITHDIRDICNFIKAKVPKRIDGIESELRLNDENVHTNQIILRELKRRGLKFGDFTKFDEVKEHKTLKISSLITENHFRFVTSTVLKAMLYLRYNRNLLGPMIDYIKTGDTHNLITHYIDQHESSVYVKGNPPLECFSHLFEWDINEYAILITASILAYNYGNGIRFKLAVKTGDDKSIIIPFGKIIAKYGETPSNGFLELYHGNQRVH